MVFPECLVVEVAGYVKYAGDILCSNQGISAGNFITELKTDTYTDPTQLATGGASSALVTFGGYNVDALECAASPLPWLLKDVLANLAVLPGLPDQNYQELDVDRVNILTRSYGNASLFLRPEFAGITLDSLVILQDDLHDELINWSSTWLDVAWGRLSGEAGAALLTMVHELVHVRQYREMGKEAFLNSYLRQAVFYGYSGISQELEAEEVERALPPLVEQEFLKSMAILTSTLAFHPYLD